MKYKGRVVFRGDLARDQDNAHAVFTNETSSSCHILSAKILDAISGMLGCSGEDADALGAYAQVALAECEGAVETWISRPRHR